MTDAQDSCVQPAAGPIDPSTEESTSTTQSSKENVTMTARVGQKAPDFEAAAYVDGGFKNIKLSDYAGEWVVICFYPGDFTFV